MADPRVDDVVITAVQFGDEGIEIQYFEKRDQGKSVGIFKTMARTTTGFEETISDIQDAFIEMVEEGGVALRNPPQSLASARERIFRGDEAAT